MKNMAKDKEIYEDILCICIAQIFLLKVYGCDEHVHNVPLPKNFQQLILTHDEGNY